MHTLWSWARKHSSLGTVPNFVSVFPIMVGAPLWTPTYVHRLFKLQ